jgi:AcrR family transcriptional regulator
MVNMFTENEPSLQEGSGPRRRGRPKGATPQSVETRRLLYGTATRLFAQRGYEATTLREIAKAADVSPALLYRYFPSKRAVVLELYDELSVLFVERAASMPSGKWRDRFAFALKGSLDVLGPHRDTLVALVPVLVGGRDDGLFAPATAFSRERVQAAFVRTVAGAKDAPRGDDAAALGRVLYLLHLGVLLWWLLDRSEGGRSTARLVALIERALPPLSLALRLSSVRGLVRDLDALSQDGLLGAA